MGVDHQGAGKQLVQHDTQAEDVDLLSIGLALQDSRNSKMAMKKAAGSRCVCTHVSGQQKASWEVTSTQVQGLRCHMEQAIGDAGKDPTNKPSTRFHSIQLHALLPPALTW